MQWLLWFSLALVVCAAVTDARTGLIPNWLTLPALLCACGLRVAVGGLPALWEGGVGLVLVSLPNLLLFVRGALGGGDVKLFAALGLALGPSLALGLELLSLLLVTGWVLCRAVWNGQLLGLLGVSARATLHLAWPARFVRPVPDDSLHTEMRLGPFIAVATLAVVLGVVS